MVNDSSYRFTLLATASFDTQVAKLGERVMVNDSSYRFTLLATASFDTQVAQLG